MCVCVCVCQGCNESLWLGELLCSLAEIVRLQDPGSIQLEMVSVARRFPDLRYTHTHTHTHTHTEASCCGALDSFNMIFTDS